MQGFEARLRRLSLGLSFALAVVPVRADPRYAPWNREEELEAAMSRRLTVYPDRLEEAVAAVFKEMPKLGCRPSSQLLRAYDCEMRDGVFRGVSWVCPLKREAVVVEGLRKTVPVTDDGDNTPIDASKAEQAAAYAREAVASLAEEMEKLGAAGEHAKTACALAAAESEWKREVLRRHEAATGRIRFDFVFVADAVSEEGTRESLLLCRKFKQEHMSDAWSAPFEHGKISACGAEWPPGYWSRNATAKASPCHGAAGHEGYFVTEKSHEIMPMLAFHGGASIGGHCGAIPSGARPAACTHVLRDDTMAFPSFKSSQVTSYIASLPGTVKFVPENPAALNARPGDPPQADRVRALEAVRQFVKPASFAPITDFLVSDALLRYADREARGRTIVRLVFCGQKPVEAPRPAIPIPGSNSAPVIANPTP